MSVDVSVFFTLKKRDKGDAEAIGEGDGKTLIQMKYTFVNQ
jgi:hypothetical protein